MKNTSNNGTAAVIIAAVVAGALGFFGGMKYQSSKQPVFSRQLNGQGGQMGTFRNGGSGPGGARAGGTRPVSGEILSSDEKSITVKLQDGSSKLVLLTNSTQINKASQASKTDLATGVKVAVFGQSNADGSVTAQNIQLNPMAMGFGGENRSPNTSAKSADAKEVVVSGADFSFTPNAITVKKGQKTRVVFKNTDGTHDFVVDELGIRTAVIRGGAEDFVEFTPEKTGTFEFYCSVGQHRQMGMKGTITVQ